MATPFGVIYSTNITPDPETGIGTWPEAAFTRAMREGVARDAFAHGARKGGLGPGADTGLGVGGDVGRVDHTEGRRHGVAAGAFLPAVGAGSSRALAAAGGALP